MVVVFYSPNERLPTLRTPLLIFSGIFPCSGRGLPSKMMVGAAPTFASRSIIPRDTAHLKLGIAAAI